MSAKYQIKLNNKQNFINIPITLNHATLGQEDIVENEFVKKEIEKAINPIVDYEKIRLIPKHQSDKVIRVDYGINLLSNGVIPQQTTLQTAGFTNDDLKFRRNNFKYSFLNLMFFDSDIPTKQNILAQNILYNKINRFDMSMYEEPEPEVTQTTQTTETTYSGFDFSGLAALGNSVLGENVTVGTLDNNISNGLYLGKKCESYIFTQVVRYYIEGFSYKIERLPAESGETCADYPNEITGDKVSGVGLGIPYGLFDVLYRVTSNHRVGTKTYTVYTKWTTSLFGLGVGFSGAYFVDNNYGEDNTVEETPSTSPISGQLKNVDDIPLRFIVEDPITTPRGFAEGFYLYHPISDLPNSIYMRANYNNAKTGISSDLVTSKVPYTVENIMSKLHTKYNLKVDGDTYYYELDREYSDNISYGNGRLVVNLYEIQVL